MLVYWIWLSRCKGLSGAKKLALCARYGDPRRVWESGGYDTDLSQAETILEDCRRKGVQILTAGDASYPRRLLDIADPPLVLYYKGRLPQFDREAAIGVVGTRNASAYGLMAAEKLARIYFKYCHKCFRWKFYTSYSSHSLFTFFLFF